MRVPTRRGELDNIRPVDYTVTQAKLERMKSEVRQLEEIEQPKWAAEVHRTGMFGDFSENAEYKEAKAKLRKILGRITSLKKRIAHAIVIEVDESTGTIALGKTVVVESFGSDKTYTIVGASEANPLQGRISHLSPLGQALIGHKVGDEILVESPGGSVSCNIKKIHL